MKHTKEVLKQAYKRIIDDFLGEIASEPDPPEVWLECGEWVWCTTISQDEIDWLENRGVKPVDVAYIASL